MGDQTGISWTGSTWNPTEGCSLKSEGCRNCYAMRIANRFARDGWSQGLINLRTGKWNGTLRLAAHKLSIPLRWKRPRRIFVNSMSDLFHEALTNEQIAAVFGVMAAAPQHTFQILTKRAERMREWFAWINGIGYPDGATGRAARRCGDYAENEGAPVYVPTRGGRTPWNDSRCVWPLPNVWIGVSVENQAAADERIPELLRTPAAVRFLSCEPLLGPVDLHSIQIPDERNGLRFSSLQRHHDDRFGQSDTILNWVIAGCESGPGARPCDVAWLRSLRDQCASAGVAYFLKQAEESTDLGDDDSIAFDDGSKLKARRPGGNRIVELPYLDGVQHAAFPVTP